MTDRGAALSDRAPACPFVAFDDDRDERADRPDHRHRCYAEVRPAPRAIAHQESYCLSPRFPTCPTFQDWARREAAQARAGVGRAGPAGPAAGVGAEVPVASAAGLAGAPDDGDVADDETAAAPDPFDDDLAPRGRQPRDWAAPPPWVSRAADTDDQGAEPGAPGAGLATSRWLADVKPGDAAADDEPALAGAAAEDMPVLAEATPRPELAGLVGRPRRVVKEPADRGRRERLAVGQARPVGRGDRGRDRDDPTPSWERPRRFEAYPSIRSRVVFPSVPRVALGVIALLVAAVLLFTLPALFFNKSGPGTAVASPTLSPSATRSLAPTPTPASTPLTYTVKAGDTLIKIANRFKVTQKQILTANPDLKNANLIAVGQVLIIPTPPPPDVIKSSSGPSTSPSGSAAP